MSSAATKTSVVAVIPNYNMAESLGILLPQILKQKYDDVYVLDDASTDNSKEVVASFGDKVHLIAGSQNIGAAGNRNRILGKLSPEAIIHFVDADMRLNTPNIPAIARELMRDPKIGFIGGLVYQDGQRLAWNYGPRQCLRNTLVASLHLMVLGLGKLLPGLEQWLRKHIRGLRAWPNPRANKPRRRRIFWVSEANMLIRAGTFKKLKGFDRELHEHEIAELGIRTNNQGFRNYFDPIFAATHTSVRVRDGNRLLSQFYHVYLIARKHGLRQWFSWSRKLEPAEQFDL